MGQLGDLLLIRCLQLLFDFGGLLALLEDFPAYRPDFIEGVVAQAGFFDAFVLELQFADEIGVMNEKDGAVIRLFGERRNFEQPLRGFQFFGVMPESPRWHLLQRHIAGAADLQQRIARHRVERLDAAVEQDRQSREFAHVKLAVLFRRHHGDDLRAEQRKQQPGQGFPE